MRGGGIFTGGGRRPSLLWRILFPLCAAATILFILGNSAQAGEASGARSQAVMQLLNGVLERINAPMRFSEHIVRKLGHFCEYALLGFWLLLTLLVHTHRLAPYLAWPLLAGLLTAVGDELFQVTVPGRSGQVTDVAIDFGGILAGMLFGWLISAIIYAVRRRKQ